MRFLPLLLLIISYCLASIDVKAGNKDISPLDFGLLQAKNGTERYNCLYQTHCEAIAAGVNVSYRGIDSLEIEIPKNAKSIPLTVNNDFCGMVLTVTNNSKTHFVFEMVQEAYEIDLPKEIIDIGDFSSIDFLSKNRCILILEDKLPWVKQRRGYEYGAIRKDLLYVENGKARNSTISCYNNESSDPIVQCFPVSSITKKISNITFIRNQKNTMRAYLVNIINQSNIRISNVRCETPPSDIFYDYIIRLENCANISFKDITINGTYSTHRKSGYGISLDNVYNIKFNRLKAKANWGVFGNNNVNSVVLKNCDINRFDVHCYGRDIFFEKCKFRDLYNQFSSIYGTISFNKCEFFDFTPVLFEPSYNAYTKFDLIFKNCIIHASRDKNFLISAGELKGDKTDERAELSKQKYPNVYINGLRIDLPDNTNVYYLYKFKKKIFQSIVDNVPGIIQLKDVKFTSPGKKLDYIEPMAWKTALELGVLTIAGSGVVVSSFSIYNWFKNRRECLSHS